MPVICVARGGSATAARRTVGIILDHASPKRTARLIRCDDYVLDPTSTEENPAPWGLSKGRSLMEECRRGRSGHDLLVIDASAASNHAFAIAAALSDLILLPLHVEKNDDAGFVRDAGLVDIVAGNMRRHCKQMVFLATNATSLPLAVHVEIAGLLMRRGLSTLAVPLCSSLGSETGLLPASQTSDPYQMRADFGECILKEVFKASRRSAGDGHIRAA